MSTHGRTTPRIIGTLREADGSGVVRLEDRFPTDVDDLWSALTEPDRLARWLGTFEGEMRPGGELKAHYSRAAGRAPAAWRRARLPAGSCCRRARRTSPTASSS